VVEVAATFGQIRAFENDFITNQIIKFGAHCRPELALLLSVVDEGDLVFDIGSHIGTFAIPLVQKIGATGRLLAVEGSSQSFSVLQRNLQAASPDRRAVALHALVARPGIRYDMSVPTGNTGGTTFLPSDTAGTAVDVVSIDEMCARHFAPRVIKIDIEGGELSALDTCTLLERGRPIVFTEVNRRLLESHGASVGELDEMFQRHGYRLFRNVGDRNAAHDRFIVAELGHLPEHLNNCDVLAVHPADDRLARLLRSISIG
jgi:FkbM family methyltransferase